MDGIILNYDPKSATGIIKTEDGKLFPFKKADWQERRSLGPMTGSTSRRRAAEPRMSATSGRKAMGCPQKQPRKPE